MYQSILLAADGSENALRAAKQATGIAAGIAGCTITVVYVIDFDQSKSDILHSRGTEELQAARRKKLIPVEEMLKSQSISYTVEFLHGEPGPAIVDYANKNSFDMLVIGSRGLSKLQEMVLGSVSHKVVKRAKCPVLVVK